MNFLVSKLIRYNGSRIYQYVFGIIITIPIMSFGMVQGWMSPMIPILKSSASPSGVVFDSDQISWASSSMYITAIAFGFPLGWLTDKFGRKIMSLVTIFSLIMYWVVKLISLEPWMLIFARLVAGFPCSACYIVLPIYLKEISDPDLRGMLGSLIILTRNIGYLASYVMADVLHVRVLLWIGLSLPILIFIVFLFMPETPEYLVKQGKLDEAKLVLAWLRGTPLEERSLQLEVECLAYRSQQNKADNTSSFKTIFTDPTTRKAFIITLVVKLGQQFDGYLIVLMYAASVFKHASDSVDTMLTPNQQVMVVGLVQLIGSIFATSLVEKTGRKMLLVSTSFLVGVGMLLLSVWFNLTAGGTWLPGWIPVFAMCFCIFSDAAGFQPISYIIITDLFTFQHRGNVAAITNCLAKAANFLQLKWFHNLNELIGIQWTLLFFTVVCFGTCFYSLFVVPETKGKTVEEIYNEISGKKKKSDSKATGVVGSHPEPSLLTVDIHATKPEPQNDDQKRSPTTPLADNNNYLRLQEGLWEHVQLQLKAGDKIVNELLNRKL